MEIITKENALLYHQTGQPGKFAIIPTKPLDTQTQLGLAYTPGVAFPVIEIANHPETAYEYTNKGNLVAVITNGTAILGLGDRGALASKPVMEGKAVLFKKFADLDCVDIELDSHDPETIITVTAAIAGTFGGINLEDIKSPECFYIEKKLQSMLDIPVFHDDQHGTAIVCAAALINALKVAGKTPGGVKVAINGAGAAGVAITKMLLAIGVEDIIVCDRNGILHDGRTEMCMAKKELIDLTNEQHLIGQLSAAVEGRDVFIGVSAPNSLTEEMVRTMAKNPIIFAMANPEPEILPEKAFAAGALVVGTGRSDFPNQINNVLVFPGLFRGALDVRASRITQEMKVAAAHALASYLTDEELNKEKILPSPLDKNVAAVIAKAVGEAWLKSLEA